MQERRFHFLRALGRIRDGITPSTANAELKMIAAQLEKQYPASNKTWTVRLETLQQQMVGDLRRPLLVIFAAVSCLLLIACVNVANLLTARITARQKEIAIRVALGAGRARILRQLLAESLLLSVPAGLIGLLLAYGSIELFRTASPNFLPRLHEVTVDPMTLLFTFLCSIVTAILVSSAPAIDIMPQLTSERLKDTKYSGARTRTGRVRQVLAISEIALSLVLLTAAGLLLKSFWNLTHVDLGINPENLLTVRVTLDEKHYPDRASTIQFVEAAMQKLRNLPGVEYAAAGTGIPLVPAGGDRFFTINGRPAPPEDAGKPNAQFRAVTTDYFKVFSISLIRGRTFDNRDDENSPKVAVINEPFAKQFFPNEDPVGRHINITGENLFDAEIIGIVKGARQNLISPPGPEMYVLHKQSPMGYFLIALRSRSGRIVSAASVRAAIQELDHDQAFQKFRTMHEIKSQLAMRNRLNTTLLGGAAAIALLLAAVGIYGVLSFSVEQRQQEIGVRLALGAQREQILKLILHHGIKLAIAGLIFGVTFSLALTRLMRTLLFEVAPHDPLILALVSLVLAAVAIFACLIPALKATRIDPLRTLRYE
jgi:putative ABC transport system permease protein